MEAVSPNAPVFENFWFAAVKLSNITRLTSDNYKVVLSWDYPWALRTRDRSGERTTYIYSGTWAARNVPFYDCGRRWRWVSSDWFLCHVPEADRRVVGVVEGDLTESSATNNLEIYVIRVRPGFLWTWLPVRYVRHWGLISPSEGW